MEKGRFLDFEKEKVQSITLDQLKRTHKENDIHGKPLKGIYHYQLIDDIIAMANDLKYNVEIYDMFAAQNRDLYTPGVVLLPQVEQYYGERAVEAHIIRRVFTNIRLTDFDDKENTTNLAVAFHQRGIQVGFGNMVIICHNQCMLSAERYAATYSDRRQGNTSTPDVKDIEEIVRSWLVDARNIIVAEREKMDRMKRIDVSVDIIFRMIGQLTAIRVKCDSSNHEIRENRMYPLNQSQISRFTENLLTKYQWKHAINVWDIYNAATDLYKASSMDISKLLLQNKAMAEFIDWEFGLT